MTDTIETPPTFGQPDICELRAVSVVETVSRGGIMTIEQFESSVFESIARAVSDRVLSDILWGRIDGSNIEAISEAMGRYSDEACAFVANRIKEETAARKAK